MGKLDLIRKLIIKKYHLHYFLVGMYLGPTKRLLKSQIATKTKIFQIIWFSLMTFGEVDIIMKKNKVSVLSIKHLLQ